MADNLSVTLCVVASLCWYQYGIMYVLCALFIAIESIGFLPD